MKHLSTPIGIIALALLAIPAWAHDMSGNPDMKQSILNVHDSHFPHQPGDSHAPEKGDGDTYGSALNDLAKK